MDKRLIQTYFCVLFTFTKINNEINFKVFVPFLNFQEFVRKKKKADKEKNNKEFIRKTQLGEHYIP